MGRSIRMFLVDGTATGIITAEIMNWTGHVVTGPRSRLSELLKRDEASRTGVYFLVGEDPETGSDMVYVGESDDVAKRLQSHSRDAQKDFFGKVAIVTSKDQNLTKAHARFLESRLIRLALASGRSDVANGNSPDAPALPEADVSDMEFFIDQVKLVLPVLGFDFLRSKPTPMVSGQPTEPKAGDADETDLFTLQGKRDGIEAKAYESDGEFIVLAGARVRGRCVSKATYDSGYKRKLEAFVDRGAIAEKDGRWVTTEDIVFSSPSAAAAVVFGRSSNGREAWIHVASGQTYGEFQLSLLTQE